MVAKVVVRSNLDKGFKFDDGRKKIDVAVDGTSIEVNSSNELAVPAAIINKFNKSVSGVEYVSPSGGQPAKLRVTLNDGNTEDVDVSELLATAVSAEAGNQIETKSDGLYVPKQEVSVGDGLSTASNGNVVLDRQTVFDVELQDAFGENLGYISSSNTTTA